MLQQLNSTYRIPSSLLSPKLAIQCCMVERGERFASSAGDPGSIPGSVRSPGEGNGNPLQYSCLGNPMDSPSGCKRVRHNLVTKQKTTALFLMRNPRVIYASSPTKSGSSPDYHICCCSSVAKSCPTLGDPMDCSGPGSSVLHCLLKFAPNSIA